MAYMRENQIYCGSNIKEVDIIPISSIQYPRNRRRRKKQNITAPKQKTLNDARARRYFVQLCNSNFGYGDYHLSLTYDDNNLPDTVDEADKIVSRYIDRLKYRYKKLRENLKYIIVTASTSDKESKPVRIHHHVLINGIEGIGRDEIENMWRSSKKQKYGFANCDRLQPDGSGIARLAAYLQRQPKESLRRSWRASINLKKPQSPEPNDEKYSHRQVKKIADTYPKTPNVAYWERMYPGWTLQPDYTYSYQVKYNEYTGYSIYLKLMRKQN